MTSRPIWFLAAALFVLPACQEEKGGFGEAPPNTADNVDKQRAKDEKDPSKEPPPDFEKALKMAHAYDKAKGELVVTVSVQDGYHAYAPGNEIGVPVGLTVADKNGWKLEGEPNVPAGKEKDLGELGVAKVLTGTFPVSAKVAGGNGALAGEVQVQICTSKVCDRPRQHAFEVAVPDA